MGVAGMDALAGLIAGSVVAIALSAFKLIERMIDKGKGKSVDLSPDVKTAIFDTARNGSTLIKQHAPEGGVERWKWPIELTDIIRVVGETQRSQCALMERWEVNLDKHREWERLVLVEIRDALRGLLQELK